MVAKEVTDERFWGQGIRINKSEDVMLACGTLITPICFKDIYYHKNQSMENLDVMKVVSIIHPSV